jgi:hypothetical protein
LKHALAILATMFLLAGCANGGSDGVTEHSGDYREPTLEVTGEEGPAPGELQYEWQGAAAESVVLRLEGGERTRFSGVCTVGEERTVISGQVPRRYTYELGGRELRCRIQKQSPGSDVLRVILTDGERTRSVQQTNRQGGTIEIVSSG